MRLLLSTLLSACAISNSPAALVAHWRMDEGAGATTIADSSGNGNTASEAGAGAGLTLGSAGVDGTASSHNGTGFWVTGDNPSFESRDFTVSFWIKADPQTATWRTAVSNRAGEDGFIFYRLNGGDNMQFWMKGPGGAGNWNEQVGPNMTDFNQWYHVVGTYDDSTQEKTFYFHGQSDTWGAFINTITTAGPYVSANDQLGIGARGPGGALPWGGGTNEQLLDDVQYYDEALTASQVEFLFNNPGSVIPEPSAVALLIGAATAIGLRRRR